eukprot:scaffold486_cov347-Prasinococcus_capsulatus_cf.AAC.4
MRAHRPHEPCPRLGCHLCLPHPPRVARQAYGHFLGDGQPAGMPRARRGPKRRTGDPDGVSRPSPPFPPLLALFLLAWRPPPRLRALCRPPDQPLTAEPSLHRALTTHTSAPSRSCRREESAEAPQAQPQGSMLRTD